jgi:hypothetical protein
MLHAAPLRARVLRRLQALQLLVAAFASECGAASGGAAAGARGDGAGAPPAGGRRLGAITGDEFLPEPLPHPCEMPPHLYPQRRYEHGTEPLLQDSEEQSEHERLKAHNGGEPPDLVPGWVKHLRLKVRQKSWIVPCIVTIDSKYSRTMTFSEFLPRIAQRGHLGAIAPRVLDAAALQRRDDTAYVHERDIWERVCGNMVDLMDVGCGHNAPNVEAHILKSPLYGDVVDNYTRALTFENVCGGNAR